MAERGEVLAERAETAAFKVGPLRRPVLHRPPWYLNVKYWATVIFLVQVVLLFFFG